MKIIYYLKKSFFLKYSYQKIKKFKNFIGYLKDYWQFNQMLFLSKEVSLQWSNRYICIDDKTSITSFDTHYVYHTAWATRVLQELKPKKHIDISSSIYFNAIASAFIPIEFYDYRPVKIHLAGLSTLQADILSLPFEDNSITSLSCMHVIEHIGLGRYGDSLDINGDKRAISELKRVLSYGGHLLIVVPVGIPKICFNAHRIYSYEKIINYFHDLKLVEFSLLLDDDKGALFIPDADSKLVKEQLYGCGCFLFQKQEEKI